MKDPYWWDWYKKIKR